MKWKGTDGNPYQEITVYVLRGDYRKVVAFAFTKHQLIVDCLCKGLVGKVDKTTMKAISLQYMARGLMKRANKPV